MLRLKNKKEKRSPILLIYLSNQKVKREDPLEIRVGFAIRTIGSEDAAFCQSHASTAFFFFQVNICVCIITITYACSFKMYSC